MIPVISENSTYSEFLEELDMATMVETDSKYHLTCLGIGPAKPLSFLLRQIFATENHYGECSSSRLMCMRGINLTVRRETLEIQSH